MSYKDFEKRFSWNETVAVITEAMFVYRGHVDERLNNRTTWDDFISNKVDPNGYLDSHALRLDLQTMAFFSKNADLPVVSDPKAKALETFLACEKSCELTNERLRDRRALGNTSAHALIFSMRGKISSILGDLPSVSSIDFSFGPGANVGCKRLTSVRRKLSVEPTLTSNAAHLIPEMIAQFPHWHQLSKARLVDGGELAFVPKDALTHRPILIEPLINSVLQKGYGGLIRNRLALNGVRLDDQSINQELARKASLDGSFATVDMKSASDSISFELVRLLLPDDWFFALYESRSPYYIYEGSSHYLHKWSSMGNGYTFELESLIFAALCLTLYGKNISVYGDDLVIPTADISNFREACNELGFTVNSSKSFFGESKFRESCGKDYLGGIDVRPIYLKTSLTVKECIRMHNFFYRRGFFDVAYVFYNAVPKFYHRFTGPDGYGDGHFLSDDWGKPHKRSIGYAGYTFQTLTTKPIKKLETLIGDHPTILYKGRKSDTRCKFSIARGLIRDRTSYPLSSGSIYSERGGSRYRSSRVYVLGK